MFIPNPVENPNDQKIKELAIQIETLDQEVQALYEELEVDPKKLSAFVADQANFTPECFALLTAEKKKLEEKLQREITNIQNPKEVKKRHESRQVDNSWLFVR